MKQLMMLLLPLLFLALGCRPEPFFQSDIDEELIQEYVRENQLPAQRHASGVYYIIHEPGSGGSPNINSEVQVRYKGYLMDGSVFDETTGNNTAVFFLRQVIVGWQHGVPLLQRGGNGTFIIPSGLGYGRAPQPGIPANSNLIFDIELVNFQ